MFKSLKRRGEKVKQRVDFKFGFSATKVPLTGWDKLVVSAIPLEAGKASFKTTRASARNGSCQWPDAIIESAKLVLDSKTKEYDEKLYKFTISTGSSRSGVLGEVTIDVTKYTASNNLSQIALPLKNCSAGTILHTNITCLTPRPTSSRNLEKVRSTTDRSETSVEDEALSITDDDMEDSDQSDNLTAGSVASNTNATTPRKGNNGSQNKTQMDGLGGPRRYGNDGLDSSIPRVSGQNGSARTSTPDLSPSSSMNSGTGREPDRERVPQRTTSSQDSNNTASSLPPAYARATSAPISNGPSAGSIPKAGRPDSNGKSNERGEWATSQRSRVIPEISSRATTPINSGGKDALQEDLAAAETTIEELRLETVTAQRQNRKLNIEVDTLKQQLDDHIRNGAENGIEMTTLAAERDRLRQELEQVRSSKIALEEKESGEGNARWKIEDAQRAIRELKEEASYQKEQNANLNLQLRKTQDSNMELVLAIRDLEESVDQHKKEAEELTILNNELEEHLGSNQRDSSTQMEQEWKVQISGLEEEKRVLEAQVASLESAQFSAKTDDEHVQKLERMIEQLTRDVEELEKESKELADENMDLYSNVEGMKREIQSKTTRISQLEQDAQKVLEPSLVARSLPEESPELSNLRNLVKELEGKLSASEDAHSNHLKRNKGHVDEIQTLVEELRTANVYLERRLKISEEDAGMAAADLEVVKLELANFAKGREEFEKEKEDLERRVATERETLERSLGEAKEAFAAQEQELRTIEESATRVEEERSIALDKIAGMEDDISRLKAETRSIIEAKSTGESFISELQELKSSAEAECMRMEEQVHEREAEVAQLYQQMASHVTQAAELEARVAELEKERAGLESSVQESLERDRLGKSRIKELEFQLSVLSEEMESVSFLKREFEENSLNIVAEKKELEAEMKELKVKLQLVEEEGKARKDHTELLEAEFTTLQSQVEMQTSSRRNLERRASELESSKDELYNQLTDMEEEKLKQAGRVSGLEAQLRFVTEERETHKLERGILEARSLDHLSEKGKFEANLQIAAKEQQQKVYHLEAKLEDLIKENEAYGILQQELQRHVQKLEHDAAGHMDAVKALKDKIQNLESISVGKEANFQEMSENYSAASKTVQSLEAEMVILRAEIEEKTGKFLSDQESLKQSNIEIEQRAKQAEESLRRAQWEKAAAVERLQMEVQRLTERMTSTNDQKEKLASVALVEALELRAEKGEWEARLRQSEEKVRQADEEYSSLKAEYGSRMQGLVSQNEGLKSREQEVAFKLSETVREFGDLKLKEVASRSHAEDLDRKLVLVLAEKESLEAEVDELKIRVQDSEMLGLEIQRMQTTLRQIKIERDSFDDSAKNLKVLNEYLEQEKSHLEEDITAWEKENEQLKHEKIAVEEKILRLQMELETQGAAWSAGAEQQSEFIKLRRQNSEFKRKLTEHEEAKEEFRMRVQLLEGELKVEKKLKDKDFDDNGRPVSNGGSPGFLQRSLSRSNSKINPMAGSPSRDTKELNELREKVKLLQVEIESKATVLDTLKRDFSAKESILYKKIELLEGANEQLVHGGPDLGMDQLQMELTRLQTLNAVLARRERELVSQLSTQDVLHKEVQRLQEENEKLENRFVRFKDSSKSGNLMERIVILETELAEALEANSMYKAQLRTAFAKEQNVQAAALHDYGDANQIIGDLVRLKKQASMSQEDVKDLRERYSTMSLQYAEVSAEKEELVMALRNLRNGKRS